MSALWDPVLRRGRVADALADDAWRHALLEAEAALVLAQGRAGLLDETEAERIAEQVRTAPVNVEAVGEAATASGNPVPPIVIALTERVGEEASAWVHRGATSQDIVDTAAVIVARDAAGVIRDDLRGAADRAAALAAEHRATPMAGRTLLQQAAPTTFGLVAAGWALALDTAEAGLARASAALPAQLGGAVGTLSVFGEAGPAVLAAYAAELGLAEPVLPWHTDRTRVGEAAGALGVAAGAAAKVARDITLLAQSEVGEVRDTAGGGSSAMPHKSNPVAAVLAAANAAEAPGLVGSLLAAMAHEHQRAAGAWHAEWRPVAELLGAVGSALAWLREALGRLEVDAARMRANLDATRGLLLTAEAVAVLAPAAGRSAAEEEVGAAARSVAASETLTLSEALGGRPDLDGERLLGGVVQSAARLTDRALAARGEETT